MNFRQSMAFFSWQKHEMCKFASFLVIFGKQHSTKVHSLLKRVIDTDTQSQNHRLRNNKYSRSLYLNIKMKQEGTLVLQKYFEIITITNDSLYFSKTLWRAHYMEMIVGSVLILVNSKNDQCYQLYYCLKSYLLKDGNTEMTITYLNNKFLSSFCSNCFLALEQFQCSPFS